MIRLTQLLHEMMSSPKAIFMAGPAGAGKTFTLNKLGIQDFIMINVDEDYEELLKKELGKEDFASMTPEELSIAGKLMGKARVTTREKETQAVKSLQNIIIDGTGAASRPLLKKKEELETRGYETFMIMIYVSPMTSLERNSERERSLPTSAVLKSWQGLVSNIETYKQAFGNNIILINNDPPDLNVDKSFDPERIQQLFPMPQGKPKTPEELAKSKADKEKTNQEIKALLNIEQQFDTFDEAKQKIDNFIK
jgi:dephospho-CoA kinase